MDQKKTGEFIQSMRKEKGLTQAELAEKLSVSDRAVSKWERGKCFPDASILESLCIELGITVNELFSGEKISEDGYKVKAEDNLLDLAAEKKRNKTITVLSVVGIFFFMIPFLALIIITAYANIADWVKIVITAVALVYLLIICFIAGYMDCKSGYFECKDCGERFQPTFKNYLSLKSMHMGSTRYLKCPHCGKRTWCKKRYTKK